MSTPVVRTGLTAEIAPAVLAAARRMLVTAFDGDFGVDDWQHALGGRHAWVVAEDGPEQVVAHGSLQTRTCWLGEQALRVGYVEAVGVAPAWRGAGLGGAVMGALERHAPAYDLLALSASASGYPLYQARGWRGWRGPTGVRAPHGAERTPEDDDAVMVLGGRVPLSTIDLAAPLWCDWREGDVW